ncbi:MAG: glycosyltransferase family 4 protein [Bacteroidetes bacterium]|nr:glycosyltransferase family 4 protein [Bacteroidota bacterium]
MKIWNIVIGEPLPLNNNQNRLHRSGLLNDILVKSGHEVHLWSSTFDHFSKEHHFSSYKEISLSSQYKLHLLHGCSYKKNISFQRIRNHSQIAKEFNLHSKNVDKPNIIICGYPSIELAYNAVRFAKKNKIPIVIDARDMWPDIFSDVMPAILRPLAKLFLLQYSRMAKYIFSNATSIVGITDGFVDWGLSYANRDRSSRDKSFYLAYPQNTLDNQLVMKSEDYFKEKNISKKDFIISYVGAVALNKINISPVFDAAKRLKQNSKIKFVIAGEGDDRESLINKSKNLGLKNVIFTGWINQFQTKYLLKVSKFGLVPLNSRIDYKLSIPNKPIEYLANNLPILSSLKGELHKLIDSQFIGYNYDNGAQLSRIITEHLAEANREDLVKNTKILFEKKFTAEKVYSEYEFFLKELVSDQYV